MDYLNVLELPALRNPAMIMAFAGWPDAHEGATRAVRYLVKLLRCKKCAELDPEEFYDFTQVRPITRVNAQGERTLTWPANDFYYYQSKSEESPHDLLLFVGIEPQLKWKTYARTIMSLADRCGVKLMVHLGSLLDAVPHTREPTLTGSANQGELRERLEAMGLYGSNYKGPTGIATAVMAECRERGIPYASLWGHSAHYLRVDYNPKVSYVLLRSLSEILSIKVNLQRLRTLSASFEQEVDRALSEDPEAAEYVRRLEQEYDRLMAPRLEQLEPTPPPPPPGPITTDPEQLLRDLEEFLRRERERSNGDQEE